MLRLALDPSFPSLASSSSRSLSLLVIVSDGWVAKADTGLNEGGSDESDRVAGLRDSSGGLVARWSRGGRDEGVKGEATL
jgi:hypothetical protein